MSNKTHIDKTSADAITVAFDYQYYYFLSKVFSLESGQSAGLEVKDDVHTELSNNIQLLIQLKHSIQNTSSGNPINLTTFDSDLWHTLYNWCEIITDKEDGRSKTNEQMNFVEKTYFLLVTNKSFNVKNKFIKILNDYKKNISIYQEVKSKLQDLETKGEDILKYKNKLLSLEDNVLGLFLQHIEFNLNEDNLIKKCKLTLKSSMI